MGYFRPVADFNLGKKSEFNERVFYNEKKVFEDKQLFNDETQKNST